MTNTGDVYDELKTATTEELLLAMAWCYEEQAGRLEYAAGLRMAVKVLQPEGWKQLAPAWLKEYRETLWPIPGDRLPD